MSSTKLLGEAQLLVERERLRAGGMRVGFTNGCFDLLHVGHTRYLHDARQLVGALIVGVNADASVRVLKGPGRPVVPEDERAEMIAALAAVDYVVLFAERTAERIVEALRPDVYFKGGDYSLDPSVLPEASVVQGYGGEIRLMPVHAGRSSSVLLARLKNVGG